MPSPWSCDGYNGGGPGSGVAKSNDGCTRPSWVDPHGACHPHGPKPKQHIFKCRFISSISPCVETIDPHTATAWQVLEAYLEGDGGTFYFGDGDFFSEQMKKDPFIRRVVGAQIAAGKFEGWTRKSYQGAGGKVIAAGDVGSGNWERAALGSYKLEWSTDGAVKDGVAQVTIHITNKMTNSSIAHFVGYGGKAHAWVTNQLSKVNHAPALTTDLLFTMNIPVG